MSCVRIFVYSSIADNAEPFFLGRYRTSTVSYQGMTTNFRRVCRVVEPSRSFFLRPRLLLLKYYFLFCYSFVSEQVLRYSSYSFFASSRKYIFFNTLRRIM